VDYKLIWTESALDDLQGIVEHVASGNGSDIARKVGFEIYDRLQILKQFPQAGAILPEKEDRCWRRLVIRSWKAAYKVDFEAKIVYVARIWHASKEDVLIE
jgi:plasmid stabilization system protein ParE